MPDSEKAERARRIRALREHFELTQEQAAEKGGFKRELMSKFESGKNSATTYETQRALARSFELRPEHVAEYLDGELSLEELIDRRNHAVHSGAPFDMKALELVNAVKDFPGLNQYIIDHPKGLTVAELAKGIATYRQMAAPRSQTGKGVAPLGDWGEFFRRLREGASFDTEGTSDDVVAATKRQVGRRPKLPR